MRSRSAPGRRGGSVAIPTPATRRSTRNLEERTMESSVGIARMELVKGDFLKTLETASAPDLIFYDPFSYKTDPEFWTSAVFSRIFGKCSAKPAELYTYSCS